LSPVGSVILHEHKYEISN